MRSWCVVLLLLVGCDFAPNEGTIDPTGSVGTGTEDDNVSDADIRDHGDGRDDDDSSSGDCCEDDDNDDYEEPTEWLLDVRVGLIREYDYLEFIMRTRAESHWIGNGEYDPADVEFDDDTVRGFIRYDGRGDLELNVVLDGGDDYAFYNYNADSCRDLVDYVTVNGERVYADSLSWTYDNNPGTGEGCNGVVDHDELEDAIDRR